MDLPQMMINLSTPGCDGHSTPFSQGELPKMGDAAHPLSQSLWDVQETRGLFLDRWGRARYGQFGRRVMGGCPRTVGWSVFDRHHITRFLTIPSWSTKMSCWILLAYHFFNSFPLYGLFWMFVGFPFAHRWLSCKQCTYSMYPYIGQDVTSVRLRSHS